MARRIYSNIESGTIDVAANRNSIKIGAPAPVSDRTSNGVVEVTQEHVAEYLRHQAPKKLSWKEQSGRTEGRDSYQFGDVARSALRSTKDWADRPKRENGYELGDLFL